MDSLFTGFDNPENKLYIDPENKMLKRVWNLYYEGFRNMPQWGKILWMIVIVKVLILFLVFKFFLMPDYLNTHYTSDQEKSNHVLNELTNKP